MQTVKTQTLSRRVIPYHNRIIKPTKYLQSINAQPTKWVPVSNHIVLKMLDLPKMIMTNLYT